MAFELSFARMQRRRRERSANAQSHCVIFVSFCPSVSVSAFFVTHLACCANENRTSRRKALDVQILNLRRQILQMQKWRYRRRRLYRRGQYLAKFLCSSLSNDVTSAIG